MLNLSTIVKSRVLQINDIFLSPTICTLSTFNFSEMVSFVACHSICLYHRSAKRTNAINRHYDERQSTITSFLYVDKMMIQILKFC